MDRIVTFDTPRKIGLNSELSVEMKNLLDGFSDDSGLRAGPTLEGIDDVHISDPLKVMDFELKRVLRHVLEFSSLAQNRFDVLDQASLKLDLLNEDMRAMVGSPRTAQQPAATLWGSVAFLDSKLQTLQSSHAHSEPPQTTSFWNEQMKSFITNWLNRQLHHDCLTVERQLRELHQGLAEDMEQRNHRTGSENAAT